MFISPSIHSISTVPTIIATDILKKWVTTEKRAYILPQEKILL